MIQLKTLAVLSLFLGLFTRAGAQKKDSLTASGLQEIVVSAHRNAELKRNVVQQIVQIKSKQIQAQNTNTTADLLEQQAVAFVQRSQQGGGSPTLRGFEASRVLLTIDGVRMNNLIYRAGHLQNLIGTDQNMLDHIEIGYGPGSTMYGSDALGGSIHLFTKDPTLTQKSVGLQSRIKPGQSAMGNMSINFGAKKLASLSAATLNVYNDLIMGKRINPALGRAFGLREYAWFDRMSEGMVYEKNPNPYKQVYSGYEQLDILQKFIYTPKENVQHKINFQYSTTGDVPRYDRLTDFDKNANKLKYIKWYYGPQKRRLLSYVYEKKLDTKRYYLNVNEQQLEESRQDQQYNKTHINSRLEKVKVYGLTAQVSNFKPKYDMHVGLDAQWSNVRSTARQLGAGQPINTRYPDGGSYMGTVALYLNENWKLSDRLIINDGIRVGYSQLEAKFIDKTFFNFPFNTAKQQHMISSASIGLVYFPQKNYKLGAIVSTGYRAPNVDDLAKVFETTTTKLIVPNADLKPEKTINYELVFNKLEGDLRFENSVYYTRFTDAIVVDKFTLNGQNTSFFNGNLVDVYASQNKRKANIYGFSSQISYDVSPKILAKAAINYTKGRILVEKLPLDHIPPLYGVASLNFKMKNSNFETFVVFNGWKRIQNYYPNGEDNEQYAPAEGMPSWYTLHMRYIYNFSTKSNFQIGVDNLLDLQYRTFASGINAQGRRGFVALNIQIGK